MLLIGTILLLLGTSLGEPATKTEVKYDGPEKITVVQEEDNKLALPGIGQPPFAPNLFHHGANFFFNSQVVMPGGIPKIDREIVIPPLKDCNINVVSPEEATVALIEKEPIVEPIRIITELIPELPSIAIQELESQKIPEPIPDIQVVIEDPVIPAGPELPTLIEIPKLPVTVQELPNAVICENVENDHQMILDVPMVIEEPIQPTIPNINTHIGDLPPPPELPPLVLPEILRPTVIEESKRVVLIPSAPQLTAFYPPSVYFSDGQPIPTDCAQNIILERVLPNLAFDYGRTFELISIPASKRPPVVSTIIYP